MSNSKVNQNIKSLVTSIAAKETGGKIPPGSIGAKIQSLVDRSSVKHARTPLKGGPVKSGK